MLVRFCARCARCVDVRYIFNGCPRVRLKPEKQKACRGCHEILRAARGHACCKRRWRRGFLAGAGSWPRRTHFLSRFRVSRFPSACKWLNPSLILRQYVRCAACRIASQNVSVAERPCAHRMTPRRDASCAVAFGARSRRHPVGARPLRDLSLIHI